MREPSPRSHHQTRPRLHPLPSFVTFTLLICFFHHLHRFPCFVTTGELGIENCSCSTRCYCRVDEKQGSDNRISNGSKADDCEGNYSKNCSRKKLRLDKDQITLLEESFEQHSSLTMAQKQILAERLHLKPRQVEVWFQNRRARTKLKQTEIDRKFLKKNCERLSDENRQLKRQLLELRPTVKTENPPQPPAAAATPLRQFFHSMPMTAAALKTCPSCEKTWNNRVGAKQEMPAAAVMEVSHGDKLNSRAGWLGKLGF